MWGWHERHPNWRGRSKRPLFADGMIVQLENPRTSTGYPELMRERNAAAGPMSTRSRFVSWHLQQTTWEESREPTPFAKPLKRKISRNEFSQVEDSHTDSDKTQLQEIKEGYINGNSSHISAVGDFITLRWPYSPKWPADITQSPPRSPNLCRNGQPNSKILTKIQDTQDSRKSLQREKQSWRNPTFQLKNAS